MRKGGEEEKERGGNERRSEEKNVRNGKEMMVRTVLKVEEEREGYDMGDEKIMAVGI